MSPLPPRFVVCCSYRYVLVPRSLCEASRGIVLTLSLYSSAPLRLIVLHLPLHFRRHTPVHPLQLHDNCIAADTRERLAASADTAEPTASQLHQFSATLPHCRLSFQRKYCNCCNNCNISHILGNRICKSALYRGFCLMVYEIGDYKSHPPITYQIK